MWNRPEGSARLWRIHNLESNNFASGKKFAKSELRESRNQEVENPNDGSFHRGATTLFTSPKNSRGPLLKFCFLLRPVSVQRPAVFALLPVLTPDFYAGPVFTLCTPLAGASKVRGN
jgi:hypothetical protein